MSILLVTPRPSRTATPAIALGLLPSPGTCDAFDASRAPRPKSLGTRCILTVPWPPRIDPDTLARERAHELVRSWDGRPGALGSLLGRVSSVDQVGVEERVDALKKRSIKKQSKLWALDLAIRMMDLTTLEGKDTPGKVRALCAEGDAPAAGRPDDPVRRGDLRLSRSRRGRQGGPQGLDGQGRLGRDRLPVGPDLPRHQARRDPGGGRGRRRRDRHGDRPRRVPERRLPDRLRGDRRRQGRCRRRPSQGDPRDRRARDVRQRPAGERSRDGGRRGLHQDLDRQGRPRPRRCR